MQRARRAQVGMSKCEGYEEHELASVVVVGMLVQRV